MPHQHIASGARRRERWIVIAAALAIVAAHPGEPVRLSRRRCDGATALIPAGCRCP